jgi:hypothetical protein
MTDTALAPTTESALAAALREPIRILASLDWLAEPLEVEFTLERPATWEHLNAAARATTDAVARGQGDDQTALEVLALAVTNVSGVPDFAPRAEDETDAEFRARFRRYFSEGAALVLVPVWMEYNRRAVPDVRRLKFRP